MTLIPRNKVPAITKKTNLEEKELLDGFRSLMVRRLRWNTRSSKQLPRLHSSQPKPLTIGLKFGNLSD